ncbi:MAG: RlmE family RNA methyltransferase [Bacteriovoracia bacterium]
MTYNRKDYYFRKAKEDNFAARSVYKLEEIDKKFRLIKSGDQVLDLGAAPGSWSQYVSGKIGKMGRLLGIDLQEVRLTLPNAVFVQGDFLTTDLTEVFRQYDMQPKFHSVLSDMAPRTTGIRVTDQARSLELCEMALTAARKYLLPGGSFVCKLFHSEGFEPLRKQIKEAFNRVEVLRPQSTRKESKEIFLIGIGFKPSEASPSVTAPSE